MLVYGCDGLRHDAEPLYHDGRRDDELLHDDERHEHDDLQHDHGHVQDGDDEGRHVHDVDQRRRRLLRHDSGLLRCDDEDDGLRLHLLHLHERHPGLLLLLLNDRYQPN